MIEDEHKSKLLWLPRHPQRAESQWFEVTTSANQGLTLARRFGGTKLNGTPVPTKPAAR